VKRGEWLFFGLLSKEDQAERSELNPFIQPAAGLLNPVPFLTWDVTVAIGF
jgi:hypothetical protein